MEQNTKDSRSFLMLLFPVGLLFLSLVILFGLGFRFYFKSGDEKYVASVKKEKLNEPATNIRDSLQQIYRATINELDNRLDSIWNNTDTLTGTLQVKLNEFYKLRKEITGLLKTGSSNNDLLLASEKISDLQRKVAELNRRNQDVEDENKRLTELLAKLKAAPVVKEQQPVQTVQQPVQNKIADENSTSLPANNTAANFTATDIRLAAVKLNNDNEEETADAVQAEKLIASFAVRNNYSQNNTEVQVVIIQPDGQVWQPSAWESGTFNTNEGKKIYSGKMRFDYSKGENKRLRLTLSADKLQQGSYILQLYHNGTLIGRTVKQLG